MQTFSANPEAATFILFEQSVVAGDFAAANRNGTQEQTLRALNDQGKLILFETLGDSFNGLLHVYVDESAPGPLKRFVQYEHHIEKFEVREGPLHFSGTTGYTHPDEFHLPDNGTKFSVRPGTYRVCIEELAITREHIMLKLAEHVSRTEYLVYRWFERIMVVAALVLLLCLSSFFLLPWTAWVILMLFVAALAALIPRLWCRSRPYAKASDEFAKLMSETPSLIATFGRQLG